MSPSTPQNQEQKDWRKSITVPDEYSNYGDKFIELLSPLQSLWDGYLDRISTVRLRVDLESPTIRPIHSVPYHAKPKASDFERTEIERMVPNNVTETARTEWASAPLFEQKKKGTLRFFADYGKLNAVIICGLYPLSKVDKCIVYLADAQVFSALDQE